ncbi:hypothetical protein ABXT63_00220 [Candidatus Pelagibacter sp. Uisw_092]|jgi:hypothetical protein|uniref:hypothetical protein n=1 Tax=Candidatus Pelagibacter sp. Uisw_092 TaxID=3230979 RepID=UPI0039EA26E9
MNLKKNFNYSVILTACIKPVNMPFVERVSEIDRLIDYKETFTKWCNNQLVDKIIFVENSGYDLSFFKNKAAEFPQKKIEIISSNLNNSFEKKLGKGYGEYLCFKEVVENSKIFKDTDFFIKITGRYYIKNYIKFFREFKEKKSDIYVCIKNNLSFADSHVFGGSRLFFLNYVFPFASKIDDSSGVFMEHCLAKAALLAVNDNLIFNHFITYPDICGIIGTNNKKIKNNFIKKIKLFFFGRIKNYLLGHKKY